MASSPNPIRTARPGQPLDLTGGSYFELSRENGGVDTLALALPASTNGKGAAMNGLLPEDVIACVSRNLSARLADTAPRPRPGGATAGGLGLSGPERAGHSVILQAKQHLDAAVALLARRP